METPQAEGFDWKELLSLKGATVIALSGVLLAGVTTASVSYSVSASNKIILGVKTEGRPINGMSVNEAKNFFSDLAEDKMHNLHFVYGDREFEISPEEINLTPLVDKAVDEAKSYGRGGNISKNLAEQVRCALNGREIKLSAEYDENLLAKKLNSIAEQINVQPVNAVCRLYSNGLIEKIPGVVGKKLDTQKLAESLKEPLSSLKLPAGKIELQPEDIQPFVRTEDIANIDSIIGHYSTKYFPGDRGNNIWLAANALTNKLVKTGWIFSFNDTVGRRTQAAGYKTAGVIIDGQMAQDIGGGVCQVSSTLYNAVLLAGLTPTVRTPHYYKSTYVAPGRDATVADDLLDFKFRNDLPHNVYLVANAYGSTLTVYILGTQADLNGASISIESEGSDMMPSIYRVYRNGGKVVKSEFLHTDVYHTQQ